MKIIAVYARVIVSKFWCFDEKIGSQKKLRFKRGVCSTKYNFSNWNITLCHKVLRNKLTISEFSRDPINII